MFNSFPFGTGHTFETRAGKQYDWFEDNSAEGHNYTSKPWGLGAFGYDFITNDEGYASKITYIDDVIESIEEDWFPRF